MGIVAICDDNKDAMHPHLQYQINSFLFENTWAAWSTLCIQQD